MVIATVEINSWEKFSAINPDGLNLLIGDFVIINTEFGKELGKIIELKEAQNNLESNYSIEKIASESDKQLLKDLNAKKDEAIEYCREAIKKYNLNMKLVDCHYSFDEQRLSFAFIADGRVDFRELVKELVRHFQKSIRLHQIGVRDEAKIKGDIGCCGLEQCCRSHLKKLGNVTSEFADDQQIVHRGSERLSGICGRLKCCLAYEEEYYQELIKKLPPIGTKIKTKYGKGEVVGWHVLKSSVDIKIDPEKEDDKPIIIEIPINK